MINKRYQGKIVRWNDDRGFGFIQTNGIKKDIFLHISAIKQSSRRPQVGDAVYFDLKLESGGKYKAIAVSFNKNPSAAPRKKATPQKQAPRQNTKFSTQRMPPRRVSPRSYSRPNAGLAQLINTLVIGLVLAGLGFAVPKFLQSQSKPVATSSQSPPTTQPKTTNQSATENKPPAATSTQNCKIKGNVSYNNNKKLYHKPGYPDYAKVKISTHRGERWFCSEQEAINAGFKDAENQ